MKIKRNAIPAIIVWGLVMSLLVYGCEGAGPAIPSASSAMPDSPGKPGILPSSIPVIPSTATAAKSKLEKEYSALAGTVKRDVIYNTTDNIDLKLDLYFPKTFVEKAPAVLYVHGGGWTTGDKNAGAGSQDVASLRDAGFIVVPINYRLAPAFKFPAMIEDVKCAVRFLRAHAAECGINPDKIGAYGGSAGGHLVSLLGVTDGSEGWDTGPYTSYSSRVQAVVDMFGPADLTTLFTGVMSGMTNRLFGVGDSKNPLVARFSPVTWVSEDDPPFLILQGDKDAVVPLSQSQEFYNRLVAGGVEAQLVIFKNGTHGLNANPGMQPTRQELTQILVQFFQKHLL